MPSLVGLQFVARWDPSELDRTIDRGIRGFMEEFTLRSLDAVSGGGSDAAVSFENIGLGVDAGNPEFDVLTSQSLANLQGASLWPIWTGLSIANFEPLITPTHYALTNDSYDDERREYYAPLVEMFGTKTRLEYGQTDPRPAQRTIEAHQGEIVAGASQSFDSAASDRGR